MKHELIKPTGENSDQLKPKPNFPIGYNPLADEANQLLFM